MGPAQLHEPQPAYPLELFLCARCGHAQLLDVVPPEVLFGSYIYETASSPGLVAHFESYAEEVVQFAGLGADRLVIDIGSNDGTLLRFFKQHGLRVLGVDPAERIARRATDAGIKTIPSFLDLQLAERIVREHGQADLVTANNVFAHADDLGGMAASVRRLLTSRGLFVFEVSYLLDMIEAMVFDFIYHEHLSYHSVKPLRGFLRRHDLELIDVVHVPSKGGSLRCVAQVRGAGRAVSPSIEKFGEREEAAGLYTRQIYTDWAARIEDVRRTVSTLVSEVQQQGAALAGYGASATSTVLIHHLGLGEALEFLVDDSPDRQGLFSPGHHIPVVSADSIYDRLPSCVVVLAWRFADMIIEQHRDYLRRGGQFLVPLPRPGVISSSSHDQASVP